MSDDLELAALNTVVAAIAPLDFAARDRVLDYARKRASDTNMTQTLCRLAEMWQDLTKAVSETISGCKTCGGLRFKDGEPCPSCYALYKVITPEGADEVLNRIKSLKTEEKS